ncbi:hypothetical protein KDK77_02420 [bacterium]|nr:hypothetical protein [bacterium]
MKQKIMYSVAGEGFGHAAKALAVKELLKDEFDIIFLGGGKAFEFLTQAGEDVIEIPSLRLMYKNDAVSILKTTLYNLPLAVRRSKILDDVSRHIVRIDPACVISDFEYFVPRAAARHYIPTVQLSHQMILLAGKFELPARVWANYLNTRLISRLIIPRSTYSMAISFFRPPIRRAYRTSRFNVCLPVLRKEILNARPSAGDSILVYSSCETYKWILDVLVQFTHQHFIVYGIEPQEGRRYENIIFKKICPAEFVHDLAAVKAVISNGGHTLISEALYLKKPVFSMYVKKQFEQLLNALHIESLGYGARLYDESNLYNELYAFFQNIPAYADTLNAISLCGNHEIKTLLHDIVYHAVSQSSGSFIPAVVMG